MSGFHPEVEGSNPSRRSKLKELSMVTIVRNVKEQIAKEVTCRHCASVLRYLPCDIRTSYHRDISGCNDAYKRIICPNCSGTVTVN